MHTYERFNLRLFPWFLLLISLYLSTQGLYIQAAIFGTPGGLTAISFKGFKIDPKNKRIKHYDRFLWFYFGKWINFSTPQYVTVVSIKLTAKRSASIAVISPQSGKPSQSYKLNLIVEGKQRFVPLTRGKRAKLIEEALVIGRLLGVRVLDYTTHEKHWLG